MAGLILTGETGCRDRVELRLPGTPKPGKDTELVTEAWSALLYALRGVIVAERAPSYDSFDQSGSFLHG